MEILAKNAEDDEAFALALGKSVARFPNGFPTLVGLEDSDPNFGSSGFSESLTDDAHPARHFSASVVLGFYTDKTTGIIAGALREIPRPGCGGCSWRDVLLAALGVKAGAALRRGEISRHELGDFVREFL